MNRTDLANAGKRVIWSRYSASVADCIYVHYL